MITAKQKSILCHVLYNAEAGNWREAKECLDVMEWSSCDKIYPNGKRMLWGTVHDRFERELHDRTGR